nr:Chain A, M conotoxin Mr3.4 [synthetic construct]
VCCPFGGCHELCYCCD